MKNVSAFATHKHIYMPLCICLKVKHENSFVIRNEFSGIPIQNCWKENLNREKAKETHWGHRDEN